MVHIPLRRELLVLVHVLHAQRVHLLKFNFVYVVKAPLLMFSFVGVHLELIMLEQHVFYVSLVHTLTIILD